MDFPHPSDPFDPLKFLIFHPVYAAVSEVLPVALKLFPKSGSAFRTYLAKKLQRGKNCLLINTLMINDCMFCLQED